jgi:pilus assembly protein CpaD
MKHSLTALALLGCSVLAGCGTENRGLSSVHQPVVARTDYVYDMPAPTNGLGESDDRALTGWFESLSLRYGDRISVDTQGYGPDARDAVSAVVARYGCNGTDHTGRRASRVDPRDRQPHERERP